MMMVMCVRPSVCACVCACVFDMQSFSDDAIHCSVGEG